MKAFYHMVWANNPTGAECCQMYICDMKTIPWYQERFVVRYHFINGLHHTFVIRKRGVGKGFFEVGVASLREEMRRVN